MHTPANITQRSMDLTWNQSSESEEDFSRYQLYRGTTENVNRSNGTLVASIPDIATTSFTDTDLELRRTYYYKIYVVNQGDVYDNGSNEEFATTLGVGFPFSGEFETGTGNWDLEGTWALTTQYAHGGSQSLTDSPLTLYQDNVDASAKTGMDLSGATRPLLTFWDRCNLASGDYGYVEISRDNEASWDRVYFKDGTQLEWQQQEIDLGRYAGEPDVRIRFRLVTDGSDRHDGWYIDDVCVQDNMATIAFPLFDDMEDEAGESNWIRSSWGRIATDGHSGTHCWTDSPLGNYPPDISSWLTLSGTIDLSTAINPQLVFWHRHNLYSYPVYYPCYDYGRVYISTDGGKSFAQLARYKGGLGNFTHQQIDLSAYAGRSSVVIGFNLYSHCSEVADGWYIDDVAIYEQDEIPPTVDSVSPANNEESVSVAASISVTFSEAMDESTINTGSFTLEGSAVSGTVTYNSDTHTATFTPDANLDRDHQYTATLSTAITDVAGNPLATAYSWSFTTTSADEVVTFPDGNLEAAIREAIGKPSGDIYLSDLVGLTELDASYRDISNLAGLEYCVDLACLDVSNNQISDVSPLVLNPGFGEGDEIDLRHNPLSTASVNTYIPQLQQRDVQVLYTDVEVSVDAPDVVPSDGDFTASIDISNVTDLNAAQYEISFDPSVLRLDDITSGQIGSTEIPVQFNEASPGTYTVLHSMGLGTVSGSGYLSQLHFHVIGSGGQSSHIDLSSGMLSDMEANEILAVWTGHLVNVVSCLPGDCNGDGEINVLDMTCVARIILGLDPPTPCADCNEDGEINVLDMTCIARKILGLD